MARAEGDIVITVGGNVSPLTDAVTKAERTLGKLNSATQRADKQFRAMVGTSTEMQARIGALSGVTDRLGKSAERSAEAFAAFDRSKAAVDRLRASYDPLFAASKRYEAAVEQLDEALRRGVITQGQYATMTAKLGQSMLTADGAAGLMAGQMDRVGGVSARLTGQVQNASYQVGDFFVQIASGTGAMRAMSQQLPQLLGGFGMWGAVAGAAVAIGGALVPMFFGAGEAAKSFKENIEAAEATLSKMKETAAMFSAEGLTALKEKYGEVNLELINFLELQAQIAKLDAMDATRDALAALKAELSGDWFGSGVKKELEDLFGLTLVQANNLYATMRKIGEARTFDEQLSAVIGLRRGILDATGGIENMNREQLAFYRKVLDSENALRQLAAAAPEAGWLAAAIGQAETLASKLWDAVAAKAELSIGIPKDAAGNPVIEGTQNTKPRRAPSGEGGIDWGTAPERKGGGGGGKGEDEAQRNLEKIQKDFMTEQELLATQYEERLLALQEARQKELLTEQQYQDLKLQAQKDFNDKMRAMDAAALQEKLSAWSGAFGDLSSLMNTGNKKLFKIGKAAALAQAVVDGWSAATNAWDKGMKVGGPATAAAFAAMSLARTGAMIASIKSTQFEGGGTSAAGGSRSAPAPATSPQKVANYQISGDVLGKTSTEELFRSINQGIKDGYTIHNVEWVTA